MNISKLTDKNEMTAYEYCKQVIVESAQSDQHLSSIDELALLLADKNSYVRTRGFGLICSQARWDHEGKIKSVWDKMIPLLNDPKPTVDRQCLASLHDVVLYLPEMTDDIVMAIRGIDLSKYKDSMSPLIKKNAEDVLSCLSAGVQ